jgi:hypothetical protein
VSELGGSSDPAAGASLETGWLETGDGVIRVRGDGIVELRHAAGAIITLETGRRQTSLLAQTVAHAGPRPLLVIAGRLKGMEREARLFLAHSPEAAATFSRVAVVTSSPVGRVLASIFLGFHRPSFPMKMFGDRTEAEAWLAEEAGG